MINPYIGSARLCHPDKNSNLRILKMAKEQWYVVRENKENLKRKYLYF